MRIKSFIFNDFQENTYVVYDDTKECIIIDPGCYLENEKNNLKQFIIDQKLKPVKLINTHCHIDHILGNKFVCNYWNVDLHIHKEDFPILNSAVDISKIYGFDNYEKSPNPKYFLNEGDKIYFGKSFFEIIFTPGHAPGHISLYSKKNNILLSGDVIFKNSIGRTDLLGGDYTILINSINKKICQLPNNTQIYCGHGPATELGIEKENNPFLV